MRSNPGRRAAPPRALWGTLACLAALLAGAAFAQAARAAHHPVGPCSPGYENVRFADLETFFDGKSNLTICLTRDLGDPVDFNVRWSNVDHVTVRSAPGHWHRIRSRIWIDDSSSNVTLYGLTLDASDFTAEPGATGLAVNADNVRLMRNLITNGHGPAGSCITSDPGYGIAADLHISANRIFDCGRDETHDHGIYTNAMVRPTIRANWIYESAGRGINLGPATRDATVYRNVIADNCADPAGGVNDCSANVMFWGSTSGTWMDGNTIAFPQHRWNVAGCDDATGPSDCRTWTGAGNAIGDTCLVTTNGGYSGEPPGSGISPGFAGKYATVGATAVVQDPSFANRSTPVHAHRNYRVRNGACTLNQPQQSVGPPAP